MNGWTNIRDFINSKDIGFIFNRKELIILGKSFDLAPTTMDTVRNTLVRGGFFTHLSRGKYQFVNKIPVGSTLSELYALAFKDKLTYLEKVVARKERDKASAERQAALEELQNRNLSVIQQAKNVPCLDCKVKFHPCVMIFSYRDPARKYKNIVEMISDKTEKLLEEIGKCDMLCMNCQAIRNAKGQGVEL